MQVATIGMGDRCSAATVTSNSKEKTPAQGGGAFHILTFRFRSIHNVTLTTSTIELLPVAKYDHERPSSHTFGVVPLHALLDGRRERNLCALHVPLEGNCESNEIMDPGLAFLMRVNDAIALALCFHGIWLAAGGNNLVRRVLVHHRVQRLEQIPEGRFRIRTLVLILSKDHND